MIHFLYQYFFILQSCRLRFNAPVFREYRSSLNLNQRFANKIIVHFVEEHKQLPTHNTRTGKILHLYRRFGRHGKLAVKRSVSIDCAFITTSSVYHDITGGFIVSNKSSLGKRCVLLVFTVFTRRVRRDVFGQHFSPTIRHIFQRLDVKRIAISSSRSMETDRVLRERLSTIPIQY